MPEHVVSLSSDRDMITVAVQGSRTAEAASEAIGEIIAFRASSGAERILFDTVSAQLPVPPEALMARALDCGERLKTSKVAILAEDEDCTYARLWRKGLADTGHEAIVFTDREAAESWLLTRVEADALYLP